jgi:hypothetical protein
MFKAAYIGAGNSITKYMEPCAADKRCLQSSVTRAQSNMKTRCMVVGTQQKNSALLRLCCEIASADLFCSAVMKSECILELLISIRTISEDV